MFDLLMVQLAKPWVWVKLAVVLVATFAIWRMGRSLLRFADQYISDDLIRILKLLWLAMCIFAALSVAVYAVYLPSVPVLFDAGQEILSWFRATVGKLVAIVALALIAWNLLGVFTERLVPSDDDDFTRRTVRLQTLRDVVQSTLRVVVVIVAIISGLQTLGINATTLLAGVSVLGVAVGFGAQSLVKDVFNGFFILLEDQYGVGDVITINNSSLGGTVERLNLRVTTMRALDGTVNIVPNGQIQTVSVSSKDWSQVVADVDMSYSANVNDGLRVLRDTAQGLYSDSAWHDNFLAEPDILGVVDLGASGITLRALFKVQPKTQYAVGREFNRRIKIAMDDARIDIPYPQRSLSFGDVPINVRLLRGETAPPSAPAPQTSLLKRQSLEAPLPPSYSPDADGDGEG